MLDLLIAHGQVVDGTGMPRYSADVAVEGNRIAGVGRLGGAQARVVLDASGCVVSPGFVDMHSHADFTLPLLPTADSLVHQGITTVVVGQCGSSVAPLLDGTRQQVIETLESEDLPLPWDEWTSFGSYCDYLARLGTAVNVVPLVGQGTVRAGVMGFSASAPREGEIQAMQAEVARAMADGAIGVSTGLIYPPGSYASTEELIAITRPAGERRGFYFSHIRGEGETLLASVAEAICIGRETGAAVQISHFKAVGRDNWHLSAAALELVEQAQAEGLDVTTDLYPYLASSNSLSAVLPQWALEGGKEATLKRLADADVRQKMATEIQAKHRDWAQVFVSVCPRIRGYEGYPIAELAAQAGKTAVDWIFDTLLETELDAAVVSFGMSAENRRQELRHPSMMIGTDGAAYATEGPLARGKPHPRSFGTFPRVLAHYVREQAVLSLEEAIHRMCGLPAEKLRWPDRGLVKKGHKADLVIFDPDTVNDRATYELPQEYPTGVHHVVVNGKLVVHEGVHTQACPGLILGRS